MRILRIKQVIDKTGLSRSTIYALIARGDFVKSIAIGVRAIGFVEEEVDTWIKQRVTASRNRA